MHNEAHICPHLFTCALGWIVQVARCPAHAPSLYVQDGCKDNDEDFELGSDDLADNDYDFDDDFIDDSDDPQAGVGSSGRCCGDISALGPQQLP